MKKDETRPARVCMYYCSAVQVCISQVHQAEWNASREIKASAAWRNAVRSRPRR